MLDRVWSPNISRLDRAFVNCVRWKVSLVNFGRLSKNYFTFISWRSGKHIWSVFPQQEKTKFATTIKKRKKKKETKTRPVFWCVFWCAVSRWIRCAAKNFEDFAKGKSRKARTKLNKRWKTHLFRHFLFKTKSHVVNQQRLLRSIIPPLLIAFDKFEGTECKNEC